MLEAVTYWNTLRAQNGGNLAAADTNFDQTFIRHFNLPEKRFDGWSGVPSSYVNDGGGPGLGNSDAGGARDGRVSVG